MAPKRPHSPNSDSRSSAKFRGSLSWNKSASQPAFLKNAYAALSGNTSSGPGKDGRPGIPTRPGDTDDGQGELSDGDEWDLGRGDEAPSVVVLKEGRHIDRDEVDRIRAQAKATSSADPLATSQQQQQSKSTGSLNFTSSSSSSKEAKSAAPGPSESWEDVVQRAKADGAAKALSAEQQKEEEKRRAERDEKRKKKEKKVAKKKIGMLSFDDE